MNAPEPNVGPRAGPRGDTAALRAANTARVLFEIRRRGETARVDLAQALDLSAATVTAVVGDLLARGLVLESDTRATPGRGRPRRQLALNPAAGYVAGAKLNAGSVTVAILDFVGSVLADAEAALPGPRISAEAMVDALLVAFEEVLVRAELSAQAISGFGLGVPGFVERDTGLCHWSPILCDATPFNIAELIGQRIPCPVSVDNDANLATLAELWFGHGRYHRDFLVVTVEHGVGLGVVIDGRLYRGARGLGAEFGHTKVQIDGALCRCGQRGCLEAYVADFALVREAGAALPGQVLPTSHTAVIALLAERARAGDEIAMSIFRRAGRMLGLGLANLLNLFDPSAVVLAGARMRHHALLMEGIEQAVRANSLNTDRPEVRLETHRWGDGLWARGAGALALEAMTA
ncbi:MAG: ROK family transcriptional regulator, partial [Pseudomonadota bacterium]